MNKPQKHWIDGNPVTLEEVLAHREMRCHKHSQLLKKYPGILICLTMNIAGPIKYSPLIRESFLCGTQEIEKQLKEFQTTILHYEEMQGGTGCAAFFLVQEDSILMKERMADIEDKHPIGRLFDIDVLTTSGAKISREQINLPQRRCLLCDKPAFQCGRSRAHTADELVAHQNQMMWEYYVELHSGTIGAWFMKAMMYEVTTTPKPGLVDRWHNGAHKDMDIDLFMDSIYSLQPYFTACALAGFDLEESSALPDLFVKLRTLGLEAEHTMYKATEGVNTHKGLIFSGGILCGAAGYCLTHGMEKNRHQFSHVCEMMLVNLKDDYKILNTRPPQTNGERLYTQYGITGIRGEAAAGFPLIFERIYPEFLTLISKGTGVFKSGRIILLYLIAYSEDTNIIHRSDYKTFTNLQYKLKKFLTEHMNMQFDVDTIIDKLDDYFIEKNISPGGSADLLALIYFLYFAGYR